MTIINKYQFQEKTILIQPNAGKAGAFQFDLTPQLPESAVISSIEVKTYGSKRVETTSVLVNGIPTCLENVVSVELNYPGEGYHGNHKITFIYTTTGGMKDEADFCCVKVTDI